MSSCLVSPRRSPSIRSVGRVVSRGAGGDDRSEIREQETAKVSCYETLITPPRGPPPVGRFAIAVPVGPFSLLGLRRTCRAACSLVKRLLYKSPHARRCSPAPRGLRASPRLSHQPSQQREGPRFYETGSWALAEKWRCAKCGGADSRARLTCPSRGSSRRGGGRDGRSPARPQSTCATTCATSRARCQPPGGAT